VADSSVQREWFTVSEVQTMLGIGSTKAYDLIARGELPAIRVGRALRVRKVDIDHWAERNRYMEAAK
jgi:excisionase family DNA binding protein